MILVPVRSGPTRFGFWVPTTSSFSILVARALAPADPRSPSRVAEGSADLVASSIVAE